MEGSETSRKQSSSLALLFPKSPTKEGQRRCGLGIQGEGFFLPPTPRIPYVFVVIIAGFFFLLLTNPVCLLIFQWQGLFPPNVSVTSRPNGFCIEAGEQEVGEAEDTLRHAYANFEASLSKEQIFLPAPVLE